MPTTTVTGEVPAEQLGVTLPHEHLLVDISVWADEEGARRSITQRKRAEAEVTLENRWWMRTDRAFDSASRKNWRLDERDLAVKEANRFVHAGGTTLVDVTPMSKGLGRDPVALREIAHETGLNVVAGTGHYVRHAHPPKVERQSAEDIAEDIVSDLTEGMVGTDIRAGIIGEIGTSHGFTDNQNERKSVRAAALAQQETDVPITIHPPFFYKEAHDVLDVLQDAGADLENVIVGHLDCALRLEGAYDYYRSIADRGAFVQFDTFGRTGYHAAFDQSYPLDADRIDMIRRLFDTSCESQILVSQDVCKKIHLTQYGGIGYDYILRDIVPRFRRSGFSDEDIGRLLVRNPKRALGN